MMGTMGNPTPIPLTGGQYEISAGDYRATITELGAGLRQLSYRGRPVISGYEAGELPPAGAGQLLAPWPNRIDGGCYSFGGPALPADPERPAKRHPHPRPAPVGQLAGRPARAGPGAAQPSAARAVRL